MKHSICGFNHAALLLNYKCDYDDAQILNCIIGFSETGKMQKITIEGKVYFWVYYQWLLDMLPGLRCGDKRSLARRMDKYVEHGLMEKHVEHGNRTYYRFIEIELERLQSYPEPCEKIVTPVLQSTTPCTSKYNPPVLQSTSIDSIKEDKKEINDKDTASSKPVDPSFLELAKILIEKIKLQGTEGRFNEIRDIPKWANEFRKIVEIDKRDIEEIKQKIDIIFKDAFWSQQIRSAKTLREKWNLGRFDRLQERQGGDREESDTEDGKKAEFLKTPWERFIGSCSLTPAEQVAIKLRSTWEGYYPDRKVSELLRVLPEPSSETNEFYKKIWHRMRDAKDKKTELLVIIEENQSDCNY